MVGGLVQQNHVGFAHQRTRQQRLTGAPTRGLFNMRLRIERQMLEHRFHANVQLPRIGRIERAMQAVEFAQRSLGVIGAYAQ